MVLPSWHMVSNLAQTIYLYIYIFYISFHGVHNKNPYFQVFYHRKVLRNSIRECPLLEISQEILNKEHHFLDPYVVGFFLKAINCSSTSLLRF